MHRNLYSRCDPLVLLATVFSPTNQIGRTDAAGTEEILQVSRICLGKDKVLRNHRHIELTERTTHGTVESWVLIQGKLAVNLYDTDDSLLTEFVMTPGDCMTLYRGGHGFTVLEDQTLIYEFKNGPYLGASLDSKTI